MNSRESLISTTENVLLYPIIPDDSVMADYDIAWQNVHWSTLALSGNRMITLLA